MPRFSQCLTSIARLTKWLTTHLPAVRSPLACVCIIIMAIYKRASAPKALCRGPTWLRMIQRAGATGGTVASEEEGALLAS